MIVFFDGVCNLCQGSVRYLIKHDKKGVLEFASLQGNHAKDFVNKTEIQSMQSILFLMAKCSTKKAPLF